MAMLTNVQAPQLSAAWIDATRLFDADLRRRGAAEKTRRAYGVDVSQLGERCGLFSVVCANTVGSSRTRRN